METMDGLEFARAAREAGSKARIIMMSGYSDSEVRGKATAAGVDAFLEKPITARGFLETATRVLGAA
jgi:CheY-like chemotaxis protein